MGPGSLASAAMAPGAMAAGMARQTGHLSVQMLQGSLLTKQTSLSGVAGDRSVDNENSDSSFNILDFIVSTNDPFSLRRC